jgi:inorganic pyrophosphatase
MEILVYIEISKNSHIKYEFDHELNALICDRVLPTPFYFPFNYGFIPNTLSGDGDPLDAIIYMEEDLVVNSYIKCRIIGGLETIDEKGEDTKIILVPLKKVSFTDSEIESIDLSSLSLSFCGSFKSGYYIFMSFTQCIFWSSYKRSQTKSGITIPIFYIYCCPGS